MALGGEGDFTGKLRLPLPDTFSGNPADWEEWSWNFKAYISMFETGAVTLLDAAEIRNDEFLDEHLAVTLDTGDVDAEATAARVLFSRKLHYLLSQLVKDSAKLIVRQNEDSNGFETWRRLYKKFSLPGATRSHSFWTLSSTQPPLNRTLTFGRQSRLGTRDSRVYLYLMVYLLQLC